MHTVGIRHVCHDIRRCVSYGIWVDIKMLTSEFRYRWDVHTITDGNNCCRLPILYTYPYTHIHTRLTALFPGLPGWAGTRKAKPIWILLKQETVGGSGISWAVCKSAPSFRPITMLAPHHSVFYRPDALPAAQPTASKHWRYTYP